MELEKKQKRSEFYGLLLPLLFIVNKTMPANIMDPRGLQTTISQKSLQGCNTQVTLRGLATSNTKSVLQVSSIWRRKTDETILMSMAGTQPFAKHPHKGHGCCPFPMRSFHLSKENLEKMDGVWCSWLYVGRSRHREGQGEDGV